MKKLDIIKNYLNKNKTIIFWTINGKTTNRSEKYYIFNEIESERVINETNYRIKIYKLLKEGNNKFIGETSFTIPSNYEEDKINKMIQQAAFSADFVKNQYFEIPTNKFTYENINNSDSLIDNSHDESINFIRNEILKEVNKNSNIKLSANEIFVSSNFNFYLDSKGNEYNYNDTDILLEFVLLGGKDLEVETHYINREKFIKNLNLSEIVDEYIKYTEDNSRAILPETGKYDVVFGGDALTSFFNFHLFHADAFSFYNNASIFKPENPVHENPEFDKLTLISDPFLKGGTRVKVSDDYGYPLKKYTIIENNIFKNIVADTKYSYYLKCNNTGPVTNIIVKPGKTSIDDLIHQENTLYLTRFSTFSPKEMTGAFSAEIRSGYLYKNGKIIPIKGGAVTGSMKETFKKILFSKETIQKGNYSGPKGIKAFNIDITGK